MLDQITEFILSAATSVWGYLALVPFILTDAVIPIVPSESLVISMASILVNGHRGLLVVLFLVASAAAWVGDNIAYSIGRSRLLHDHPFLQRPKVAKAFDWARRELFKRGAALIIVGRFIPGVRIAINMTCGIVGFSRRRFMKVIVVSSTMWALYSVLVGSLAGAWFEQHPFWGVVVAVGVGMVLGPAIDWLLRHTVLRGTPSPDDMGPATMDETSSGRTGSEDPAADRTGPDPISGSEGEQARKDEPTARLARPCRQPAG